MIFCINEFFHFDQILAYCIHIKSHQSLGSDVACFCLLNVQDFFQILFSNSKFIGFNQTLTYFMKIFHATRLSVAVLLDVFQTLFCIDEFICINQALPISYKEQAISLSVAMQLDNC